MAKVHNAELLASDDLVVKLTNLNGDWEQGVVPSDPNSVVSGELGDLVVQENDGAIWKNTDGVTEWKQILAGREVYAFNGAPSGTPDNLDAVAYDYSTGELYYWDPVALAWETAAGNVLDWHQTGNAGTSPLSTAGPDYVGTSDDVGFDIATDATSRVTVGDTANDAGAVTVHPDGTNDRVTITDVESTITHTDGSQTATSYTGDSILGSGESGAGGYVTDATHTGIAATRFSGTGVVASLAAADSDFTAAGSVTAQRDSAADTTGAGMTVSTDNGNSSGVGASADGAADSSIGQVYAQEGAAAARLEATVITDVARMHLEATDGVDLREINVLADEIEIGAGDVASNTVGGTAGDIPVRFGTGSVVRFDSLANIIGNGYAESRVVAAAGTETITHSLAVVASLLGDYPVNVTVIDDATNQVVIPDTIDFTVSANAIDIGFAAAGTYNIYIGRMIG
jgi:hypothetical protein